MKESLHVLHLHPPPNSTSPIKSFIRGALSPSISLTLSLPYARLPQSVCLTTTTPCNPNEVSRAREEVLYHLWFSGANTGSRPRLRTISHQHVAGPSICQLLARLLFRATAHLGDTTPVHTISRHMCCRKSEYTPSQHRQRNPRQCSLRTKRGLLDRQLSSPRKTAARWRHTVSLGF